jgi:hypothetical protein
MTYPTPDWTNVLNNGVVGDGVTDDTVAIQALLTAAETSGGTLYFPAGLYVVSAQLNYSSAKPLVIYGDFSAGQVDIGTQGTCIISKTGNGSSPSHVFDFENSSMVYVHDIDIYQAATITFNAADDFVGLYFGGVNEPRVERCQISGGTGYSFNTAVELYDTAFSIVKDCALTGEVQALWFTAESQAAAGCTLSDCQFTSTAGNGYGGIRMDGAAATLNVRDCYTYRGDWGFTTGSATGNNPTFVTIRNLQINNPREGGMLIDSGSQFWISNVWISFAGTPTQYNTTEGIHFGPNFQGFFYSTDCTIQGPAHNGIYIGGGNGFKFSGLSVGGCGWATNNTYYDINVHADTARIITISDSHFDVDEYNGIAGGNHAAAAIYLASGVFHVNGAGNISLGGGSYGSGDALVDDTGGSSTWAAQWNL